MGSLLSKVVQLSRIIAAEGWSILMSFQKKKQKHFSATRIKFGIFLKPYERTNKLLKFENQLKNKFPCPYKPPPRLTDRSTP